MLKAVKKYLSKIGSKGGKKSRRTLTTAQARAMRKAREMKRQIWFRPEEAWERLCVKLTGDLLEAEGWIGSFNGSKEFMYFGCGEGCCDDWWETRSAFLKSHENTRFRVLKKNHPRNPPAKLTQTERQRG